MTLNVERAVRTLRMFVVAVFVLIFGTFQSGYKSRVAIRDAQVAGCLRINFDRRSTERMVRAEIAATRLVSNDSRQPMATRVARAHEVTVKARELPGVYRRAHTNCRAVFPPPSRFRIF